MDQRYLPAVQKAYDINRWLLPRVERMPRSHKFTLGDRLQSTAIDLNLALVEATHAKSTQRPLYRANRLLDQLRILLRLTHDVRAISPRQHEFVSASVEELGRMIGGWLRQSRAAKSRESA